jgi:hypothetical protein
MAQKIENQAAARTPGAFAPGTLVVASLANPREKFWGAILELSSAGLSARGIDLLSFDDFASSVRAESPVSANEVFFPMHRLERVEADLRNGDIPSLAERFLEKTGKPARELFSISRFTFSLAQLTHSDAESIREMQRGTLTNRATANRQTVKPERTPPYRSKSGSDKSGATRKRGAR